jgi:DNA ligase (NAD+)
MTDRQKIIAEASQAYYSTGTSPLSDAEFDALLEEERRENPNSPVLGIGHGYDINKDQRKDKKIPHKYGIVGSLDKCHNWDELPKSFKDREKRIASLKLDGSSCVMYYKNGEMYLALTRGQVVNDISVGIDITDKVKKIAPQYVSISDKTFTGAVRGETLMSHDNFKKYKELHPEASNARNSTAGLMGQKEVVDDLKFLNIIVYTIIGSEGLGLYIAYDTILAWLTAQYGKENVVPHQEFSYSEYNFMHQMEFFKTMWYNKFPADGIVLTDIAVEAVGNSRIYNSVAFKFKAEVKETTVTGIEWNLSKTKYLVPTVLVSPIELSGATVSRVAGNNAKNILDSGIGVGAKVKMYRSGQVIPYIDEVIEKVPVVLPDKCPCCGLDLTWKGVHLVCDNPDCADMKTQDLLIWCENIAPVDGLGDTLKLKFFEELCSALSESLPTGSEVSIEGAYNLAKVYDGIQIDPSVGSQYKLFYTMLDGLIHNKVPMYKALLALNIPRIGDVTAKKLAQHIDVIESLVDGCYPSDKLLDIVGEATTGTILMNLNKFQRLTYIWDNIDKAVVSADVVKVAITGSLESMPRSQFEKLLNAHGFVLGDITKDTKYLITNTPNSSSSKNAKADKLGIEKITENEFRSRYL